MSEIPKIVYDRLRVARPEGASSGRSVSGQSVPSPAHPDADLLAAFAEQALSAAEREGVLEHLALCGDCREAIALALPAADVVAVPRAADTEVEAPATSAKSRWNWLHSANLARPGLRWAALAAGVALAASVLLLHPGKLNQAMQPSANRQVAPAALPAPRPQVASSLVASSPAASSPVASSPTDQSTTLAKTDKAPLEPELRMPRKLKPGRAAPPLKAQSGMMLAGNGGLAPSDKVPAPSGAAGAFDNNASSNRTVTENVEVAAEAEAVVVEPSSQGASQGTLMARNAAPAIERAKPAQQEVEVMGQQKTEADAGTASVRLQGRNVMSAAKLAPSSNRSLSNQTLPNQPSANVMWTIKAGVLQRSLDNGQSWQDAWHTDHPLLCYAVHAPDLWTGGEAGGLFHSSDNGLTWERVQPSVKTHALSSDVVRIDIHDKVIHDNVRGLAEIVVSTSNLEIWSSLDGGRTWVKKSNK
jgi:hypothetical protein